jgi:hypothetical protein
MAFYTKLFNNSKAKNKNNATDVLKKLQFNAKTVVWYSVRRAKKNSIMLLATVSIHGKSMVNSEKK